MSNLVLHSDVLGAAVDGDAPRIEQALEAMAESRKNPAELFAAAGAIRGKTKGRVVSFSSKVFVNLTNLCRDTCTYCTYKQEPGETQAFMEPDAVRSMLRLAKRYGCTEALLVTGERPEEKYGAARKWLGENGFSSTPEYAAHCSQIALDEGLFPHTNAGSLEYGQMMELKGTNPSIGMMLESSSGRLSEEGMPHHLAPSKSPMVRIRAIEDAGRAKIPTTTGLLVGIGESEEEIVQSLQAIREIHKKYGHIQEVILQNFVPKQDTPMGKSPAPRGSYFARTVALARIMMPEMNIQIPPNLSPDSYGRFLRAGVNDWGGISPVTPDFVNPEMPWPTMDAVEQITSNAGFVLKCRFAVYPEFFRMLPQVLRGRISEMADSQGYVRDEVWRAA